MAEVVSTDPAASVVETVKGVPATAASMPLAVALAVTTVPVTVPSAVRMLLPNAEERASPMLAMLIVWFALAPT